MKNPYDILKCSKYDSIDTIKRCHRKLILLHHPDKNIRNIGYQYETFIEVQAAFTSVMEKKQREHKLVSQLSVISNTFFSLMHAYLSYCLNKPRTIEINVDVTLEDVMRKTIKKIAYKRYISGHVKIETIYIDLDIVQPRYIFECFGDENVFLKSFGDVVVNLRIEPGDLFDSISIDGDSSISACSKVDLYQYFYGVNLDVIGKGVYRPFIAGDVLIMEDLIENTKICITFILQIDTDIETVENENFKQFVSNTFRSS